ncbi:SGNH/GDSL hydrolase family protein [Thermodesulfobacteriota bacterium]
MTEDKDLFFKAKYGVDYQELYINNKVFLRHAKPLIVSLGGSIAHGIGTEQEIDGGIRGYNRYLLEYLREEKNFSQADMLDITLPGYTTYQSRILIDRVLKIRKPDLIFLCHGFNDSTPTYTTHKSRAYENRSWRRTILHYGYKSRIFCVYAKVIKSIFNPILESPKTYDPILVSQVPLSDYRDNLRYIAMRTNEHMIPTFFITQFIPRSSCREGLEKYFKVMEEVAAQYPNVSYVDVRPDFENIIQTLYRDTWKDINDENADCFQYQNQLFFDCTHPNDFGHYVIFGAIKLNVDLILNKL